MRMARIVHGTHAGIFGQIDANQMECKTEAAFQARA